MLESVASAIPFMEKTKNSACMFVCKRMSNGNIFKQEDRENTPATLTVVSLKKHFGIWVHKGEISLITISKNIKLLEFLTSSIFYVLTR